MKQIPIFFAAFLLDLVSFLAVVLGYRGRLLTSSVRGSLSELLSLLSASVEKRPKCVLNYDKITEIEVKV